MIQEAEQAREEEIIMLMKKFQKRKLAEMLVTSNNFIDVLLANKEIREQALNKKPNKFIRPTYVAWLLIPVIVGLGYALSKIDTYGTSGGVIAIFLTAGTLVAWFFLFVFSLIKNPPTKW